jgi:membrane associated rhomboid family serine protease
MRGQTSPTPIYEGEDGVIAWLLDGPDARGEGGVAFWAHVGGFVAGAVLIQLFKDERLVAQHRAVARTMDGFGLRERY